MLFAAPFARAIGGLLMAYKPIESYGVIGDMHSVALVGIDGSIDWCCLPHFDSPAIFAAILDDKKGGHFCLAATHEGPRKQMYLPDTNVLMTRFLGADGVGEVVDFMPIHHDDRGAYRRGMHQVVRVARAVRGRVTFRLECRPAMDFARRPHRVVLRPEGAVFDSDGIDLALLSPVPLIEQSDGSVTAEVTLEPGETATFVLRQVEDWTKADDLLTAAIDGERALERTVQYWRTWIGKCRYTGRWRETVRRSALILKLLTFEPTGAIVAAATCSLPEEIGGTRNWDYRYSWLRDATLTLSALGRVGKVDEAQSWLDWLKMISLASGVEDLQIMYGVGGETDLAETELSHLEGYRASSPVRIGNGAAKQRQIDTYGEVADALWMMRLRSDEPMNPHRWRLMRALAERTLREWREPDEGIWEVRGEPAHFVLSKVMCWVALDRAIALAELDGYDDPNLHRWRSERDELRAEILERGFDQELGSFTQSYGSGTLDASNLMLATVGFVSPDDARFVGTVRATQEHLMRGGLVDRYDAGRTDDGFAGEDEGTFAICTLWLCNALLQIGDVRAARELFDRVVGCANDLGLLAEELTPDGEQLGNYPQAYTHIALILCAFALQDAEVTTVTQ